MKKVLAGLVVVLIAAVAVQFASSATSRSSKSIPARLKALEKKVKTLSASVKTLKSTVATLETRSNCLGAQGVTQYGNPSGGVGYLYTSDGGTTVSLTTAFDGPTTGQAPSFYAATVNPACITSAHGFQLNHGLTHRTGTRFLARP